MPRTYFCYNNSEIYSPMIIDLRSDTVTKPTPAMLDAMMSAPVGDDVFGDDPSVLALETKAAQLFGTEAALFCPSGTMTNQLAIKVHTRPGDEVICDKMSHIYLYEGGGTMANSQVSVKLLDGNRGRITAAQVAASFNNPDDVHCPLSSLVSLENTMNKGGGCYYQLPDIQAIRRVCDQKGLKLHLDGARLFNALVETGEAPAQYGSLFDSISICLSKGLGCPVGSLLLGRKALVQQARRVRKRWGGGWRQAGFLAAAGIYALDHHVNRLREDHQRAQQIGKMLERLPEVKEIFPIDTNIVIFRIAHASSAEYVRQLAERGILAVTFGPDLVRFVTHLDFGDDHLDALSKVLV
jgi:threonine aldolase